MPLSSFLIIVGCLVPLTYPFKFISQPLASLLNYLTGLTEMLTEKAASLPLSTIENIGLGTIESALLFSFIFLFMLFILNRKTFPIRYPLFALLLFLLAGSFNAVFPTGLPVSLLFIMEQDYLRSGSGQAES